MLLELPGLQLHWFSYDQVMKIQGMEPPGTVAFGIDFQSEGTIRFCGQQAPARRPGNKQVLSGLLLESS
jgi:hypothetical protein